MSLIKIATRNSPLALWQANYVKDQLLQAHSDLQVEIVGMTTKGDQLLDRSLAAVGGKGLFLKELEVSLLDQSTDIAVHSMKDVPVDLPEGLEIAAVCDRADPRDAVISNEYQNLYALPKGSRVGTASLRRTAQLKSAFPALEFLELRGNVNTRLAKLDAGEYDAIILAAAGMIRLGFVHRIKQYITPELCLPAVGQGIVGIECRSNDHKTQELLRPLHSRESALMLAAERSMNRALDGGCQLPVAGFAELDKGGIRMRGMVATEDGAKVLFCNTVSPDLSLVGAEQLGLVVAQDLLEQGARDILQATYAKRDHQQVAVTSDLSATSDASSKQPRSEAKIVLLTRQERFLGNMAAILERLDYQPVHIPTMQVEPSISDSSRAKLENIKDYDDVIFVSRNAVEIGMSVIQQAGGMPQHVRVLTVGPESAKQLYSFGVDAMFPDHGSGADALLGVRQLADMSGRKVLVVRGEIGLEWPEQVLRERGAELERAVAYSQALPASGAQELQRLLQANESLAGVFVHSVQSLGNLIKLAGSQRDQLVQAKLVAGSQRIAEAAIEAGWQGEILVADSPSNKHMMISFSG